MPTPIVDAQNEATYNAENNNAGYMTLYGFATGAAPVQTVVSGTAFQVSATRAANLYVAIATSAAITLKMGPLLGTEIVVAVSASEAIGLSTLHVPAGWMVQITGTVADFVVTAVMV